MNDERTKKERSYLPRSWGGSITARESKDSVPDNSPLCAESPSDPVEAHGPKAEEDRPPEKSSAESDPNYVASDQAGNVESFKTPDDSADPAHHHSPESEESDHGKESFEELGASDDQLSDDFESVGVDDDDLETKADAGESSGEEEQETIIVKVVGVRFGYACKIYHFEASVPDLQAGDRVVVKTEKGLGLGQIAVGPYDREFDPSHLELLRKIIRKATKADFDQKTRCSQREMEAYKYCLDKIEALDLSMKLIGVECFFDASKYVFYFTAEGRVDFRELVKQLVARFPVRIEMRQIGVRHEAKMTGGLACCGQELCCSRFLVDFRPVSVKMAKNQNLSLNPTKISGVCGRLMCCLSYEHDTYESFKKDLPRVGKAIKTTKGDGVVIKLNPIAETVFVRIDDEQIVEVTKEDILNGAAKSPRQPQEGGCNNVR